MRNPSDSTARASTCSVRAGINFSWVALAAIVLPLTGCGTRTDVGDSAPVSKPLATNSAPRPFLDNIPDAPMNTAYGGTRHVKFSYKVNDTPVTIEYTEQVVSSGQGTFTVIPLGVTQPTMNTEAEDLFKLLQMHREGFMYRHRDFRIRDLGLFEQNYVVSDLGPPVTVCGRTCALIDVRRQSDGQNYYHAAVDVANGLILRYEEYANSGEMQALVEFTDFTLTPDTTDVIFHTEQMAPRPLDLNSDTTPQIGFVVHAPTLLPSSYQLETSEKIDDGTQKWARLTYGDGAEQIFFLYRHGPESTGPGQHAANPGQHVGTSNRTVRIFHFGPWIVAQGTIDTHRLIAVGKTDESALLQMIQSALH